MKWSVEELTNIRVLVGDVLDGIGLRSYVFNVEQEENDWIVSVDFSHRDEWQAVDLRVDKQMLRDCLVNTQARDNLAALWQTRLDRLR